MAGLYYAEHLDMKIVAVALLHPIIFQMIQVQWQGCCKVREKATPAAEAAVIHTQAAATPRIIMTRLFET